MINSSKRLVAMLICLALVLSMLPMSVFAAGTTVYLQPSSEWLQSGTWYAVWTWADGAEGQWVTGTGPDADGLYTFVIPEGSNNVIFVRMDPAHTTPSWDAKWNQTGNMVIDTSKPVCAVSGWGTGSWIVKGGEVVQDTTYYLRGDMNSWGTTAMTDNGNGIWTVTVTLAAGTYEYKAAYSDWTHGVPDQGNLSINVPADGDYIFTLDTNAGTLTAAAAGCAHANTTDLAAVEATCTTAGKTAGKVCADCGYVTVPQEEIPALGHTTTVEGETCTVCGLTMEYMTVYFENNWLFGNLKVHYWGSAIANTEWPGVAVEVFMTTPADENGNTKDVYAAKVPADIDGLLFNGTDNDNGSERKTPDITEFAEDKVYYMNWTEELGEHVNSYDLSNLIPSCEHEYLYACDAHCMHCGELTNEAAAHSIKHVEAVEATCQATGNIEYWYCEYCNTCWDNAEATGMPLNAMSVKTFKDHEYFYACDAHCMNCGEMTNPEATHAMTHVAAVEGDCQTMGNIEFWTCEHCGGCWDNENGTGMPLNRYMVLTGYGDHNVVNGVCTICGAASDIKWQVNKETNADSTTTDLRLITYVDSLDYTSITFKVTVGGNTVEYDCYTVYTSILAGGSKIEDASKVFGNEDAKYFVTYTLTGVPASAFDTEIQVEVAWTNLEGFEFEGVGRTIVISDYYA